MGRQKGRPRAGIGRGNAGWARGGGEIALSLVHSRLHDHLSVKYRETLNAMERNGSPD